MPLTLLADRQYPAPSAADGVAMTPSGTAWTNSAYVTVLAASPAACILTGVTVYTIDGESGFPTANYDYEVDIATGAPGSEGVIATVRGYNARGFAGQCMGPTLHYEFPIPIDTIGSGVRLAARLRINSTSTTVWNAAITFLQKPLTSTLLTTASVPKTLPPATAGVTLTAGGAAWTSGSWGQLRAASGAALVLTGLVVGAPSATTEYEVDLGTGGAGAETVVTTIRLAVSNQSFGCFLMVPTPLDLVAAATRLAARLRCSSAGQTLVASVMVLEKPL